MKVLRKSVDTAVLVVLYGLGSAFIALSEPARRPLARVLGRPRPAAFENSKNLAYVINNAFVLIALCAVAGTWFFRAR